MARVTLTSTALVPNGTIVDPTGTASVAGAGNGFTVPYIGGKSLYLPRRERFRLGSGT
jgi:hypothetical protein